MKTNKRKMYKLGAFNNQSVLRDLTRSVLQIGVSLTCALATLTIHAQEEGEFNTAIVTPDVHDNAGVSSGRTVISESPNEVIDPFSGALSLGFTDLVWPGDSGFDLRINRVYSSKINESKVTAGYTGPVPNGILAPRTTGLGWSLHFGYIKKSIVFTIDDTPLDDLEEPVSFDVCDLDDLGDTSNGVADWGADVHDNALLITPDGGTTTLLSHVTNDSSYLPLADRMDFITESLWTANCLGQGDGLEVMSPNGWKYRMDHKLVQVRTLSSTPNSVTGIWEAVWYTTQIEDRNGNTMSINYDGRYLLEPLLDTITTSDDRVVNFEYTTPTESGFPLLTTISTPQFSFSGNGVLADIDEQVWRYDYVPKDAGTPSAHYQLKTVTRPDGLTWEYDYYSGTLPPTSANDYSLQKVTYPYGATSEYEYDFVHFYNGATVPQRLYSKVVSQKTVSGREVSEGVWTYDYSVFNPDGTLVDLGGGEPGLYPGNNITTVTTPSNVKKYTYYGSYTDNKDYIILFDLVGKVLDESIYEIGETDPVMQTKYEWENGKILSSEDTFNPVLVDPRHFNEPLPGQPPFENGLLSTLITDVYLPMLSKKEIIVDDASYITTIPNAYFWYQQPGSQSESGQDDRSVLINYFPISRDQNINQISIEWINHSSESTGQYAVRKVFDTNGNLTDIWNRNIYQGFEVDAVGNRIRATTGLTLNDVELQSLYTDHKLGIPQSESHPEGATISRVVGPLGTILQQTDAEGHATAYKYDDMNRVIRVDYPSGDDLVIQYNSTGWTETRGTYVKDVTVDGFGRPVCIQTNNIYYSREFDELGRITFQSLPSFLSCNQITEGTIYEYDAIGRKTRVVNSDSSVTQFDYLPNNTVKVTDENGNEAHYYYRSYGDPEQKEVVLIESPENIDTIFEKDVIGNIESVTQQERGGLGESFTRTYVYNDRNFVIEETNPETGVTLYERSPLGHIYSKQVGNSSLTEYFYDGKFRRDLLIYPDESPDVLLEFDDNDNVTSVETRGTTRGVADISYQYTPNNILESETLTMDRGRFLNTYTTNYEINSLDNLSSITYPSGKTIDYDPDPLGRPTKALPHVTSVTRHPSGAVDTMTFSNGLTTTYELNSRQWVNSIETPGPALETSGPVVDLDYLYQPNGNIESITDNVSTDYSYTFTYDGVDRLISSSSVSGDGVFEYSPTGNLTRKLLNGNHYNYGYVDNKLEVVQELDSVVQAKQGRVRYSYDDYGNAVSRVSDPLTSAIIPSSPLFTLDDFDWNYLYNDAMQLVEIERNGEEFRKYFYDGRNLRVASRENGDVATDKHFLFDSNERLLAEFAADGLPKKDYIYLDDRLVAIDELNVEAVLDITIDTDQQEYEPGDTIIYTITVQNSGEVDATEVDIADMFPPNIQIISGDTSDGSYNASTDIWDLGDVPRESTASITVTGVLQE